MQSEYRARSCIFFINVLISDGYLIYDIRKNFKQVKFWGFGTKKGENYAISDWGLRIVDLGVEEKKGERLKDKGQRFLDFGIEDRKEEISLMRGRGAFSFTPCHSRGACAGLDPVAEIQKNIVFR